MSIIPRYFHRCPVTITNLSIRVIFSCVTMSWLLVFLQFHHLSKPYKLINEIGLGFSGHRQADAEGGALIQLGVHADGAFVFFY